MEHFNVFITDTAQADMDNIYNYIAFVLHSPETGKKQYERIANQIKDLNIFPERYGLIDILSKNPNRFRRMKVDNFSVIYCILDKNVFVTNVLYNASDIEDRLN